MAGHQKALFDSQRTPANRLLSPFQEFARMDAAGGLVLMGAMVAALIIANSPLSELYQTLLAKKITVGYGSWKIAKPLLLWINDGLMAIFFFVVGLEIKREILTGELRGARKAALPAAAALGGMVAPALFYAAFNIGGPGADGWGVPMATDIAFSLGVLSLLGTRAPLSLKVFLTALAIVDDLGAILVIALFYTEKIALIALLVAGIAFLVMIVLNRMGVKNSIPFLLVGIVMWVGMLKSGVHATIAGVLAAFTIPTTTLIDYGLLKAGMRKLVDGIGDSDKPELLLHETSHHLHHAALLSGSLLHRLEHMLHPWVAFFIMPVFALANAGIALNPESFTTLLQPIGLGILLGLIAGKTIGITLFSLAAVKLGLADFPKGFGLGQLIGVSLLAGIGFTMSLFIANLAFTDPVLLEQAKMAVLTASLIAGVGGFFLLKMVLPKQ